MLASLETQYNASKNAIPDSPFKNMGIAAGTAAAEAMIEARQGDGRFGPSQFVANANPGYWDPVAPSRRRQTGRRLWTRLPGRGASSHS